MTNTKLLFAAGILSASFYMLSPPVMAANVKPIAVIEHAGSAKVNQAFQLDGSASNDPDSNDTLAFQWWIDAASVANPGIVNGKTSAASFTPTIAGDYIIKLKVTDSEQLQSIVSVTITAAENVAPIAKISAVPASFAFGTTITLDGSASTDPDSNSPLAYAWWLSAPAGSSKPTIAGWDTPSPSFKPDVAGDYIVQLKVTDSEGLSSARPHISKTIVVDPNQAPIAAFSAPSTANVNTQVQLLGTASTDPESHYPLSYEWQVASTDNANYPLNGASAETADFSPAQPGQYAVFLTVRDAYGKASSTTTKIIDIKENQQPIALIEPVPTPQVGDTVTLDGSASSDPDSDAITYRWWAYTWPNQAVGNEPQIVDKNTAMPSFTISSAGDYVFRFQVTDAFGLKSKIAAASFTVNEALSTRTPGHYAFLVGANVRNSSAFATAVDDINALADQWTANNSAANLFAGYAIRLGWNQIEPSKDNYQFGLIDAALQKLSNDGLNQKLVLMIEDRSFKDEFKIPDYLRVLHYYKSGTRNYAAKKASATNATIYWQVPTHCNDIVEKSGYYNALPSAPYTSWTDFQANANIKYQAAAMAESETTDTSATINCNWFTNMDVILPKKGTVNDGRIEYTGMRYNKYYNARLVKLVEALAQKYADVDEFEGLAFQETSTGFSKLPFPSNSPDTSPNKNLDLASIENLINFNLPDEKNCTAGNTSSNNTNDCRLQWIIDYRKNIVNTITKAAAVFPNKTVFFFMNYMPAQINFPAPPYLVDTIKEIVGPSGLLNPQVVIGGPDTFPLSHDAGTRKFGKDNSIQTPVYQGVYSKIYNANNGAMNGRPGFSSAQQDSFSYYCDEVRLFKYGIGMPDTHFNNGLKVDTKDDYISTLTIQSQYFFWTNANPGPSSIKQAYNKVIRKTSYANGDWRLNSGSNVNALADDTQCWDHAEYDNLHN